MSDFFKNYRTFYYNIDKVKPARGKLATNLLSRVRFADEVLKSVSGYYKHRIQEGERPDTIAGAYYKDPNLAFLIFLANNIQDPLYEWPLFGDSLTNFIKEKHGSVSSARTTVHHYEQILRRGSPKTADTPKILEKVAVIDKESYDLLSESDRKIIYNYDYEIMKNNAKKQIVLIENTFSKQILNELKSLYAS